MPATVIVGLQWGDEGKGKATDFLAEPVTLVVRGHGGDNAGHTIVVGDETFKLHLIPAGVLYPHITAVIGSGVVVNPETLIAELDMLAERGIDTTKVRASGAAHVILPYHRALDTAREASLGNGRVGTTGRGIGPAYEDRAARTGLRMEDLLDRAVLERKLVRVLKEKRAVLDSLGAEASPSAEPLVEQALGWGERLRPHIVDTTWLVQAALRRGDHVLVEGAQGTLLDIDHGSYPYVTSSNAIAAGACAGAGIGPLQVDEVMGVTKAYATRVGSGPFPTELHDEIGEGIASRVLNKIDILSGIDPIRLCIAYEIDGRRVEAWPSQADLLERALPIYRDFPGWTEPIHDVRTLRDLPENARHYVTAIEEQAGVPIVLLSVGPERTQTIERAWRPMRHQPVVPG